MEITPPPPPSMPLLAIARNAGSGDLSFLKPGQLITTQVLSATPDGNLNLKLNDRVLKVVSDLQLMQGTKINLKVEIKEGQLMLRLISPQDNSAQAAQQAAQQALRQVLPKQQPMQPLFTQLARLAMQLEQKPQTKVCDTTVSTGATGSNTSKTGTTPPTLEGSKVAPQQTSPLPGTIANRLNSSSYSVGNSALLRGDKASLSSTLTTPLPSLPPKVRQALATLIKQLPGNETVSTPQGLKNAIDNSGMFFENKLLSGGEKPALQGDLKTILFRIAFLVRQSLENLPPPQRPSAFTQQDNSPMTPKQRATAEQSQTGTARLAETQSLLLLLGRQSESSLARIQMNQLSSLTTQRQGEDNAITLELPLFNGKESEVLEITIRREARRQQREAEACWSATLKLDSDDYGPVRAVVSLIGQQVSTTFWCEQPETQQHFQHHLDELRQQMEKQGLQLGRTQAFKGIPPEPDGPGGPSIDDGLFHTRA